MTVNLVDPKTHSERDLTDYWRLLRSDFPVYWHAPTKSTSGFWAVSRYADIADICRDTANFSSERGNVLITLLGGGDSAAGQMLPVTDGPRHRELRNVMLKAFSPLALDRVADAVLANTRRLVADAVRRGQCDVACEPRRTHSNFMTGLASLPMRFSPDEAALAAGGHG